MRKRDLERLLAEWAPVLRLADWDIELKVASPSSMQDADGKAWIYPSIREGEIWITKGRMSSRFADAETVLVHELLHFHFEELRTDENEKHLEIALELLSKALVKLKRDGWPSAERSE